MVGDGVGNDVVWYGTYTNREDLLTSVMEPDFHTLSMFHEELEMDLSPFHIEFEGFAVAGIPDEWTEDVNAYFKCYWYNSPA